MWSPLSRLVHGVAHATGVSTRRAKKRRVMRVLMIHGVGDHDLSTDDFEAVLRYLERHFEILPLAEVAYRTRHPLRITGREVALTFDDGLRNNMMVAYPLLREMRAPATFFVCPGLVDTGRWLWNHEVRARMASLETPAQTAIRTSLGLEAPGRGEDEGDVVVEGLKWQPPSERAVAEEAVREASPAFVPSAYERRRYDMMRWADLKTLDSKIITIGSHTITHPNLPVLDDDALTEEVVGSRRRLETALGRTVDQFCYPNGAESRRVRERVAEEYAIAVTAAHGTVSSGANLHRLLRISIASSRAKMAWRMWRL